MSIIGVKGVPLKLDLKHVAKILAKTIDGYFEALNFKVAGKKSKVKICYLRLSAKLDPVRVVEKINTGLVRFPKNFRPYAFIPETVPDIPLATKPRKAPAKLARARELPGEPNKVLMVANEVILTELQSKYPGLYNLNKKLQLEGKDGGQSLIKELALKIHDRLLAIGENNKEVMGSCFKLSQAYRRAHPHFGDFQLVLSTLHTIEDAAGTPRTQLQEKELSALPPNPYVIDNLPYNKVQLACCKYSEKIIIKIEEHIRNLKSEVTENDTEDEIVKKKVREELKKMAPFLPLIVKQVVTKHFIPQKNIFYKVRLYGEPFLPNKETMSPFLRRYQPVRVHRCELMFNLLRFNVPPSHYASLMAMDGTVLNGAKLVIRSAEMPIYQVSINDLVRSGSDGVGLQEEPEAMEEDETEDWNDMI